MISFWQSMETIKASCGAICSSSISVRLWCQKAHWRSFWLVLANIWILPKTLKKIMAHASLGLCTLIFLRRNCHALVCHCRIQNTQIFRYTLSFVKHIKRFIVSGWQGTYMQRSWKARGTIFGYTRLFPCFLGVLWLICNGSPYKRLTKTQKKAQMVW